MSNWQYGRWEFENDLLVEKKKVFATFAERRNGLEDKCCSDMIRVVRGIVWPEFWWILMVDQDCGKWSI